MEAQGPHLLPPKGCTCQIVTTCHTYCTSRKSLIYHSSPVLWYLYIHDLISIVVEDFNFMLDCIANTWPFSCLDAINSPFVNRPTTLERKRLVMIASQKLYLTLTISLEPALNSSSIQRSTEPSFSYSWRHWSVVMLCIDSEFPSCRGSSEIWGFWALSSPNSVPKLRLMGPRATPCLLTTSISCLFSYPVAEMITERRRTICTTSCCRVQMKGQMRVEWWLQHEPLVKPCGQVEAFIWFLIKKERGVRSPTLANHLAGFARNSAETRLGIRFTIISTSILSKCDAI